MLFRDRLCEKLALKQAEFLMLFVGLFAGLVDVSLILAKGATIDHAGYASLTGLIALLLPVGYYYRLSGRSERIASALICTGAFIFFSMCLSLFNYLLLPVVRPVIDLQLAQIDAMFGFHWPDIMALAADYPLASNIMKTAYMTTIPQFALLVVILGLGGRMRELHVMITSVTITATLTICFWGLFPSLGTTTLYTLSADLWRTLGPLVNQEYASELKEIAVNGPGMISPKEIRGLVAFPSYHAVLAFTAIWSARNLRYTGPAFLLLNLLILPAIFVHGGHHLVDLPAGFVMFAFGTWLATRSVGRDYRMNNLPSTVGI